MGCCGGGVILLRLRGSALLRQGLLSEPEASSAPVSMFLALRSGLSPLDWLSRNNIKTSSINLPTIQSICQILLNNKLTTAVVDKDNSILLPLFAGTITSPG